MKFRLLLLSLIFPALSASVFAKHQTVPEGFKPGLSLEALRNRASEAELPYLVYFHNPSKRQAKKMLKQTWMDDDVRDLVENRFLAASFDPIEDGEQMSLIQEHQVYGFPSLLIFSPEGILLGKSEGFLSPQTLRAILTKHLHQIEYKQDLMAMANLNVRGQEPTYQSVPRGMDIPEMTPPLLVGSMDRFSARDATLRAPLVQDLTPIAHLSAIGSPRGGAEDQVAESPSASSDAPAPVQVRSMTREVAGTSSKESEQILLDIPGLEAFSLRHLQSRSAGSQDAFGLLVGSYVSYDETVAEVDRFERLWRDRIFVYCEEVNGTLVYRVVLGEYQNEDTAEAFSHAIYRMEGINPTVLPLYSLLR